MYNRNDLLVIKRSEDNDRFPSRVHKLMLFVFLFA